ncbi:MAG TPA: MbtH family protein, partial [Thermoanaerobaculia bacterium]
FGIWSLGFRRAELRARRSLALAAPLALFVLGLRSARRAVLITLFVAIVLAAAQAFVDLRIRAIRASSVVPISSLEPNDPVRRRFGALHGVSMLLLAFQTVAAAVVVMSSARKKEPVPVPPDRPDGLYRVVVSAAGQYSIWPDDRDNPPAWSNAGFAGTREQCLAHIEEIWRGRKPGPTLIE